MLRVLGRGTRCCDGSTRREVLQAGGIAGLGLHLPEFLEARAAAPVRQTAAARSVILINLIGGPSHIDMFDMKPDAPAEIRGEFSPIDSTVPGLQVCEHLPLTAQTMHLSTLIRTHTHMYNTHSPYNMLTGYSGPVIVNNVAKHTDHPSMGAVMQYAGVDASGVPPYIWMPSHPGHSQGKHRAGPYGGFLGRRYDPLFTSYEVGYRESSAGRNAHINPLTPYARPRCPVAREFPEVTLDRLQRRQSLLSQLDDRTARINQTPAIDTLGYYKRKAFELLTTNKTRKAFDLSDEPEAVRKRYGENLFGNCVLTARRLVEAGVRFVGVTTESQFNGGIGAGQWDTHSNNFRLLKNFNLPTLDQNYTALISDLEQRGLLDSTLVVVMGEMGRTPKVNKNSGGRDHWTQCGFILLTGGGVQRGLVYGKSDKRAAWPVENPVSSADHVATIYQLLGIDPHLLVRDANGNPVPISLEGEPVHDVIA